MRAQVSSNSGKRRTTARLLATVMVLALVVLAWEFVAWRVQHVQAQRETASRWGAEALTALPERMLPTGLIAPANACGLGASSCFHCHNGFRAQAPSPQPWHTQHDGVNNSCAGCHKGNPRLRREDLAHRDLIKDPRTAPASTCDSCHRADDRDKLLSRYR